MGLLEDGNSRMVVPLGPAGFLFMLFLPDGPGRTKISIYHYVPSSIEDTEELRVEQLLGDYIATS